MARRIEQMVNEQVMKRKAERRGATPMPRSYARATSSSQRPVVAISRECGSLGGTLGRAVAERLGFTFYSQELVHEIATAAHVRRDTVESMDEHARGVFEVMVREVLEGKAFAKDDYLYHLGRVLRQLGRDGHAVVVGRGSHLQLDPAHTLRVRTYGRFERRVDNTMSREGLPREVAIETVRRVDRDREAFYRSNYGVHWDAPEHFDLMVNTSAMPLGECADIVAAAFRTRFG